MTFLRIVIPLLLTEHDLFRKPVPTFGIMLALSPDAEFQLKLSWIAEPRRRRAVGLLEGAGSRRENNMAFSTQGTAVDKRETAKLIGSDKVEGTPVYRSNGERVGKIERVMIDKLSGKVAYAVMSFGGFMGIGEDYYPLPWSLLTYNPGSTATRSSASSSSKARRIFASTRPGTGRTGRAAEDL